MLASVTVVEPSVKGFQVVPPSTEYSRFLADGEPYLEEPIVTFEVLASIVKSECMRLTSQPVGIALMPVVVSSPS